MTGAVSLMGIKTGGVRTGEVDLMRMGTKGGGPGGRRGTRGRNPPEPLPVLVVFPSVERAPAELPLDVVDVTVGGSDEWNPTPAGGEDVFVGESRLVERGGIIGGSDRCDANDVQKESTNSRGSDERSAGEMLGGWYD